MGRVKRASRVLPAFCLALGVLSSRATAEGTGNVKLGYVYTDETGNRGVYQPAYNLYKGVALSVEDFAYRSSGGLRIYGDLKRLTLKNRDLRLGIMRSGLFGVDLTGVQYRRTYDFAGDHSARRDQAGGQVWVRPMPYVKLYGGYAVTRKQGNMLELFEPGITPSSWETDYNQQSYHGGFQLNCRGRAVQAEYRGSTFADRLRSVNDRAMSRYRVTAVTPAPRFQHVMLNGGFQHFEHKLDRSGRKVSANTVWGGARLFLRQGYSLKYSFIFDRAANTGDPIATDNITQAAFAGKIWPERAGLTVGYQHKINDDLGNQALTNGYYASGWIKPITPVTLQAEFGMSNKAIGEGATLTGNEDMTRYTCSAVYRHRLGDARVRFENKRRDNDDIGSTVDFRRVTADVTVARARCGELRGSYSLARGDYRNRADEFAFTDHVAGGTWVSPVWRRLQGEIEGTYYRSKRDLDVESFSLRVVGRYAVAAKYELEIGYAAHNFDDLTARDQYYTANIVEICIVRKL